MPRTPPLLLPTVNTNSLYFSLQGKEMDALDACPTEAEKLQELRPTEEEDDTNAFIDTQMRLLLAESADHEDQEEDQDQCGSPINESPSKESLDQKGFYLIGPFVPKEHLYSNL
ncbi:hypothetical protein EC973_008192 [Apophysomyces ossiformis]|uniref:Uncharacterized protein n=1 Tax=Apophysomyces ossiformis TaxID=679940 RepID=A0A8H7EQE3_9FUNG|nr:hypothetical protein EC973_008192 [Apophysomyces ossiformis]